MAKDTEDDIDTTETTEKKPGEPTEHGAEDTIFVPDGNEFALLTGDKKADEDDPEKKPDDDPEAGKKDREERPKRNKKDYNQRIGELTRQKHEATEAAAAAAARAELLEEEVRTLKAAKPEPKAADADEAALLAKKKKALEDADLELFSEVNDQLLELRLKKERETRKPSRVDEEGDEVDDRQARREPPPIDPAAKAWIDENDWFAKPENKHLRSAAVQEQNRLIKEEGLKIGPKLYERLNERLRELAEFDEVLGDEPEERKPPPKATEKPPQRRQVVSPPSDDDDIPSKPKPGQLTEHDKRHMRAWRLNPDDPVQRAKYLANKRT